MTTINKKNQFFTKKSVSIIGGGPAAMMVAASLDEKKFNVTIYEKNNVLGRKFLVAGDGGLNSMSNTLASMATNINSLYTDTFQRAYTGYKC